MANITPETTIVLITGGNQGIGFETVKKLVKDHPDWHIILSGRRPDAVKEAAAKFEGKSVSPLTLDVTSDESIAAAAKTVEEKFGHIDVLINNSGVNNVAGLSERENWAQVYNINVISAVLVTRAFIPLLEKSKQVKRVVFVSSTVGSIAAKVDKENPWITSKEDPSGWLYTRKINFGQYAVSKSAMNMAAAGFAVEHEDDKTWKINAADPTFYCKTEGFQGGFSDPALGATPSCALAELGPDGYTGQFVGTDGVIVPW